MAISASSASFEFQLHPIGPEVLAGLIVHPIDAAPQLLRDFRKISAEADDQLTVWVVLRKAPPLPFLPEQWHGREILAFAACYAGDIADGEKAMARLRALGEPIADVIGPQPFTGMAGGLRSGADTRGAQLLEEPRFHRPVRRGHRRSCSARLRPCPTRNAKSSLAISAARWRGSPTDATAFPQRAAHFTMNVHTRWQDPAMDAACVGWARDLFYRIAPFAVGSVYVNFMPEDEPERLGAAYGGNMARLRAIKSAYDPDNLFRVNHNIQPAPVTSTGQVTRRAGRARRPAGAPRGPLLGGDGRGMWSGMEIALAGTPLVARASGALWWPAERLLCVADLHLGKSERLARRGGALLPPYETRRDARPARGGDRGARSRDRRLPRRQLRRLRRRRGARGRRRGAAHRADGRARLGLDRRQPRSGAAAARRAHLAELRRAPLDLPPRARRPDAAPGEVSGHYHPKLRLPLRGASLSRPCFLFDAHRLILPAFGAYTGGLRADHPGAPGAASGPVRAILTGEPCLLVPG